MNDKDDTETRDAGQGPTPWAVGQHPWPEQVGCCPLVGRPWSVHGTNNRNVAAAVSEDIARLIAAAPDMLEALRLHQAWTDSEAAGPDYGGQSRDTHPDGEKIWRAWFDGNLDLCDRATSATRAAIAKAEGKE